ncbi:hypothetical protein J2X34_003752 [Rhodococcus sp. BE178]
MTNVHLQIDRVTVDGEEIARITATSVQTYDPRPEGIRTVSTAPLTGKRVPVAAPSGSALH